jgi:hypothetical protein
LGSNPFVKVKSGLQAFVLEIATIDERANLFLAPYREHIAERLQVREGAPCC